MDSQTTEFIQNTIKALLTHYGLKAKISTQVTGEAGQEIVTLNLSGEGLGALIGYHGQVLNDLQYWLNLALFTQTGAWTRVVVDVNNYRQERREFLLDLTKKTADRVRFLQTKIVLPPMSSYDRFLIHEAIGQDQTVTSESVGEGRGRRVVVRPA